MLLRYLGAFGCAYLLGSIPTAFLLVKQWKGIDVRTIGSGNVGATNAARAAGARVGMCVFLIDVMKGVLGVTLIPTIWLTTPVSELASWSCGITAVLGHLFPVFLRFRGGKGVATTFGVLLGTQPVLAGLCAVLWTIGFFLTRYVSVGSLIAAITIPVYQLVRREPSQLVWCAGTLALLIIGKHHENIARLLKGEEHSLTRKPH